jgi:MFS family permease
MTLSKLESAAIQKSLEASRYEGVAAQVAGVILDCFLVPFALQLGAGPQAIGFLISVPSLFSAASQFFVVAAMRTAGCRRRLLIAGAAMQGLALLPLSLLALSRGPGSFRLVFASVVAYRVVGALMNPAWGSLMSEYLPDHQRGRYFGGRSRHVGLSGILTTSLGGLFLFLLKPISAAWAFSGLFLTAGSCRLLSCRYMARMARVPEPSSIAEENEFALAARLLRRKNFARYARYVAALTFANQLSTSYQGVHLLRDLKFDGLSYMSVALASALASLLSVPVWGRHADKLGNVRILRLNGFLVSLVPILWAFTDSPTRLTAVELLSGFVWAGFNLCSANFVFEAIEPEIRTHALAFCNLLNGAATFAGAMAGGWLAGRLPAVFGFRLHTLFLVSAALRFAVDFALSRGISEVRPVPEPVPSTELVLSVVGIRPLVEAE